MQVVCIDRLGHIKRFIDVIINDFAVFQSNNAVTDAFLKQFNSGKAHTGCGYAVANGGATATLNVTKDGSTGINTGHFLNLLGHFMYVADALCNNDKIMHLAVLLCSKDMVNDLSLKVIGHFGKENCGYR